LILSDPENPSEIGRYTNIGSSLWDIVVQENYAYLASDSYGLSIIDISDPENPHEVGRFSVPMTDITGIDIKGDIAFVTTGHSFIMVDVSDPSSPVEISTLPDIQAYYVAVKDDVEYLTGGYSGGLRMFDIFDPASPFELGYYNHSESIYSWKVDFKDEEIFISSNDDGMLIIHNWLITSAEENKEETTPDFISMYPNPTSNKTTFTFTIYEKTYGTFSLYDAHGQTISILHDGQLTKGAHELVFDASKRSPGIYTYLLKMKNESISGKFIIAK